MEEFQELGGHRGGVLYGAARVNPVTARTWVNELGLTLGSRRTEGHPRYDVLDVACLILMQDLTFHEAIAGSVAVRIVNALREPLRKHLREAVEGRAVRSEDSQYALIDGNPAHRPNFISLAGRGELISRLGADAFGEPNFIDLQGRARKAVHRMRRVLAGELGSWDEED